MKKLKVDPIILNHIQSYWDEPDTSEKGLFGYLRACVDFKFITYSDFILIASNITNGIRVVEFGED